MRQHLSQYYKVIEQNSLPIPHIMEHETGTVFMLTHGPGDRESLA
jgi:hypothetical protein